jgi:Tol biopolymer transport system component/predicted Ser/Thr protein kinase
MSPDRLRQVEELYHSARERVAGQRGAFLAEACQDDEDLRREVESLLAQSVSEDVMERPALDLAGSLADETATQLTVGALLGPYRIESPLGAGGMGQVYKARDTRLDRSVAIKITHHEFSERFEREARAISALNHPHICTVYDVGPNYLVMELVEGETLASRLKEGALPMGEVLRYGAQIADALADAHSKSITHRDLKPANIMIAKSGVKVLDFGLAKFSELEATLTQTGAVMGTLAYMAPEQMAGKEADARTDIYALGLVLYEMATGKRVVQGQPLSLDALPDRFAHVVERCLEPEPESRWQTARDVKAELDWVTKGRPAPAVAVVKSRRLWLYATAALGVVTIAVVWSVWQFRQKPSDERVTRLQIEPPGGGRFATDGNPGIGGFALSPDGRTAAFVANVGEQTGLWVRPLDGSSARLLPGTDNPGHPFWSPDSKSIAFSAQDKLQRIDLAGGSPVTIGETRSGGGVWLPDGRIVLGGIESGLFQAPAPGERFTQLTELDASSQEVEHVFPQSLPGDHLLYLAESSIPGKSAMYAISLHKPAERVRVLTTDVNALYASGYLLWWSGGALVAQEFDPATLKLGGEPHPIADRVTRYGITPKMNVAVSTNGYLLYDSSGTEKQLRWFDPSGKALAPAGELSDIAMFRISPDGRRVAVSTINRSAGSAVWVVDENSLASRVASQQTRFNCPVWSPDGHNVVVMMQSPEQNLFRINANGSGEPVRLSRSPHTQCATDWSGDGRSILYWETDPATRLDLWVLRVTPQGVPEDKPQPYLRTPFLESWGRFSPEPSPQWVTYQSTESGRAEIYVQAFPEPHGKFRISPRGGSYPAWGPDGRELYYETLDNKLVVVNLKFGGGSVEASDPRELFALPPSLSGTAAPTFDIAPDGKRFLVRVEVQSDPGLTLVTNWPALIKKGSAGR